MDKKTNWFSLRLPGKKFETKLPSCVFVDARTEAGETLFHATLARTYGEELSGKEHQLFELDLRDGVVTRETTFTLLSDQEPVGCITYTTHHKPDGTPFILLANLGVPKELQGRGIGREVVSALLNKLMDSFPKGILVLYDLFNGNDASKRLVLSLGFMEVRVESWFPVLEET